MSSPQRLVDQLAHMQQAISDASVFTEGMLKLDFLADRRTQQAVVMNLIILGEAATQVMDGFPEFAALHQNIPWRSMRGMRNRIAHGYFGIDLDVVWDTVKTALPALADKLPEVQVAAGQVTATRRQTGHDVDGAS